MDRSTPEAWVSGGGFANRRRLAHEWVVGGGGLRACGAWRWVRSVQARGAETTPGQQGSSYLCAA